MSDFVVDATGHEQRCDVVVNDDNSLVVDVQALSLFAVSGLAVGPSIGDANHFCARDEDDSWCRTQHVFLIIRIELVTPKNAEYCDDFPHFGSQFCARSRTWRGGRTIANGQIQAGMQKSAARHNAREHS